MFKSVTPMYSLISIIRAGIYVDCLWHSSQIAKKRIVREFLARLLLEIIVKVEEWPWAYIL